MPASGPGPLTAGDLLSLPELRQLRELRQAHAPLLGKSNGARMEIAPSDAAVLRRVTR